jgi:hypothetical protein
VARDWINAGRDTQNEELVAMGRSFLDAYAEHGWDSRARLFYAALQTDGTPVDAKAQRDLVTGDQSTPAGYLAIWQPHAGWQEHPLTMAQTYAWAAEHVDRDAYLPTAERFGNVILQAWQERYAGSADWFALADLLKPFALEYYRVRGVLHSRHLQDAGADPSAMKQYRGGGYAFQAPFGLFAEHYGRSIQFSLSMQRLTGERRWIELAVQVADEAVKELWRGKLFVGHVIKQHYMNTDHVGILLHALLQLDAALAGDELAVGLFF